MIESPRRRARAPMLAGARRNPRGRASRRGHGAPFLYTPRANQMAAPVTLSGIVVVRVAAARVSFRENPGSNVATDKLPDRPRRRSH